MMKYQKLTQIEHVLKRPDTYISSLNLYDSEEYIVSQNNNGTIVKEKVNICEGALKCFDEIITNARDRIVEKYDTKM